VCIDSGQRVVNIHVHEFVCHGDKTEVVMNHRSEALPSIPGWGVDLSDEARPGVPMERKPAPMGDAHWNEPERQSGSPTVTVFKSSGLERLTPVFGTAQPPKGLSGLIRRGAYAIPEHKVRHWLLLLLADRIDVAEHRLARMGPWMAVLFPALAAASWFARRARAKHRFRFALP
jgi:hypothetical protein